MYARTLMTGSGHALTDLSAIDLSSCLAERHPYPLDRGSIYLWGVPRQGLGQLEVYEDGRWGSVCNDGFDDNAAKVACRQLGYDRGPAYKTSYRSYVESVYGPTTGAIVMDDVSCRGYENTLQACSYRVDHNCDHSEDVGLNCGGELACLCELP